MLPKSPIVSVVIISRNEGEELQQTVANLRETLPAERRQLIVVDDGSTDGSTDFLGELEDVRIVQSAGVGVARARNLGATVAKGDIVLFSDAHIRAPQGWYEPMVDALRAEHVGAAASGIYSLADPARRGFGLHPTGPELRTAWRQKQDDAPYGAPILPGCFLAMRREVFRRTGGYDPGMKQLGGNDVELSCRFWLLGYELLVVPQVEVGHLFRSAAPYEAKWAALLHNRLRMAMVLFETARVERVLRALRAYEAFPAALAMMLETDVFVRRALVAQERQFDDSWYFQKFALEC